MKWQVPLAIGALLASGPWALAAQSPSVGKIQHIVVIFQENVAFDHYFATYPKAANPPGEPAFHALPHTPKIDGLSGKLLTANPNFLNKANGPGAVNPFRLDRSEAATADQDHAYTPEQKAFDHGLMDLFPEFTGRNGPPPGTPGPNPRSHTVGKGLTMGYFDGNTVTAVWNYAQHDALEQRSFGTTFGPSTVGALNLVSGQTNGVIKTLNGNQGVIDGGAGSFTDIADPNPLGDVCSPSSGQQIAMGGHNIGNLLDASKVSWGWFQGGFNLDLTNANGTTGCERSTHSAVTNKTPRDYVPHHDPFQYYASTANSQHVRPAATAEIGHDGPANHNYDVEDFYTAVTAGDFPSVSFIKAPAYANGHAGNSDPIDEQHFVVHLINFLELQPQWNSTAVIIAYDDSDGWYDHAVPPIVNGSSGNSDAYTAPGVCGNGVPTLAGIDATNPHAEGRCGYGPRLPLLVVSPWAKPNYVSSVTTDQSSILRLIEDTFLHGQRLGSGSFDTLSGSLNSMFDFSHATPRNTKLLILDEATGEPVSSASR